MVALAAGLEFEKVDRVELAQLRRGEDPWIGRILGGRYRVVQHLADGGMGRVYVGHQVSLGMSVAVKILDPIAFPDPTGASRFEREAIATASLRSPHIVQVFDWGTLENGESYLVMELLPGSDLASLLLRGGLLGVRRTLGVLRQLALAIDHAHAHGIVHRDLKPENVMIDLESGDFVKVLDFGVASDVRGEGSYGALGEVVGTPEYMPPEQALGIARATGPAADRYALAAIALEMLTGDLPYPSAPPSVILRMIVEAPPRRPSELGLQVPGLDAIFDHALARRPHDRYQSGRAFVDALEDALTAFVSREGDALEGASVRLARRASDVVARSPVERPAPADSAADEVSTVRLGAAMVAAGLVLVGSAFAAGWLACAIVVG